MDKCLLQSSASQPPPGFIHLVLLSQQEDPFYLQIPTEFVATVCLTPLKYLRYLGWCVLGVVGVLEDEQGDEILELNGKLADHSIYHYTVPGDEDVRHVLARAVDLEVIKTRTHDPSETTVSCDKFRKELQKRDGRCVWTGLPHGSGMHIVPHRRGDEWLRLIIENRPHDDDLGSLTINDIRNGVFGANSLQHPYFDQRKVVVLKTPNPILEITDVPDKHKRKKIKGFHYPVKTRYTLQWLVPHDPILNDFFPNNTDAMFKNSRLPKPADVLLHYNYGAAAVKHWGKNTNVLANRPGIPRPSVPAPAPMGPTRDTHDRQIAIDKRGGTSTSGQGEASGSRKRQRTDEAADPEVQDKWDEDDVMLFLWGNTKVARERHAQKTQERTAYLENWRAAVPEIPDIE